MAKPFLYTPILERDGSSQSARTSAALDPDYVAIDERSPADLLAFAREYAKELVYYDSADRPSGDWSGFFDAGVGLHGPRPHFALLQTFIELLGNAQRDMNGITRRHLDFYYRTILGMTTRPAAPDRVDVLLEPSAGAELVHVPAGSLLDAGKDGQGKPLAYRTDRDVFIGQAQIAELRSVHVERRTTTLRDARERHDGPRDEAFFAMLRVALGRPLPGDSLPAYKGTHEVDAALLRGLRDVVRFAREHLFLELFELRSVMQLKRRRDHADDQWGEINALLEKAARARLGDPDHRFSPADPRDFDENVIEAIGQTPSFVGLPEVSSIDDLYRERVRHDVKEVIRTQLYFADVADFVRMMQIKLRIDSEWREINRVLERAGRRKRDDESYALSPADPAAFGQNLDAAVGPVDYSSLAELTALDEYFRELGHIEEYFHMTAEDVAYVVATHDDPAASESDWRKVYDLLDDAHAESVYSDRRAALASARQGITSEERKLRTAFSIALGQKIGSADALQLVTPLEQLVGSEVDRAFLLDAAYRVVMTDDALSGDEWDRIDHIVELAQRARERFPRPVAEVTEWLDIHPYSDAASVTTTLGLEADRDIVRWKTFGAAKKRTDRASRPAPVLGWGVCSPLLAMREGQRTIALTLGFAGDGFDGDSFAAALAKNPFTIEVTTADGWVEATSVAIAQGDYRALSRVTPAKETAKETATETPLPALQVTLTIAEDADPIAAMADSVASEPWPAVRIMARPVWDQDRKRYVTPYAPFEQLRLAAAHLAVDVRGLTSLALENDDSELDASKPFKPFGNRPAVGSRLLVGHPELVQKRLDSVRFHLDWMRAPSDLAAHYRNYDISADFKARIGLYDRRRDLALANDASLFATDDATAGHQIAITEIAEKLQDAAYERDPRIADSDRPGKVSRWRRYLTWELSPIDFQHDVYHQVAASKAHEMAAAIAAQVASGSSTPVDVHAYRVNPPYTPTIKRLSVDYTSSAELVFAAKASGANPAADMDSNQRARADVAYHIHPFGKSELRPEPDGAPFLPRYDRHEGELYIGIRDLAPPQNLSLLVQMAEGSADPDLEPAAIEWSYLSGNRWVSLHDGSILADGTRGLLSSGIVELALAPSEPSTLLPGDLYWLRAAIPHRTGSVCDIVAIHTQAVSATFVDRDNTAEHYDAPLPAGTITRLASPLSGIAAAHQPYTGYGGARPERDPEFYARVSERLRHKQRALTVWDYERLVLQRFPQIYKAKCLPARIRGRSGDHRGDRLGGQLADHLGQPGQVVVVVIPNIRNQLPFDPFAPKAPASTLTDIQSYLGDKLPASATVAVRNAHYIPIKVRVSVRFHPGHDEGFSIKTLNDEINRFLSPWAYDDGVDITIGDRIYANSIIDFIDRRPYVDYVYAITLFRCDDGERFFEVEPSLSEGYYVAAERPDGVLVAARNHEIAVGAESEAVERAAIGVNHMTIGLDFVVSGADQAQSRRGIGFTGIGETFAISDEDYKKRDGVGRMKVAGSFRVD